MNNNYYKNLFKKIFKNRLFIICLTLLTFLFLTGLLINILVSEEEYLKVNFNEAFQGPCREHLFGTNDLGQDLFYLTMIGCYNTIKFAFYVTFINLVLGTIIGVIWGHNPKLDPFLFLMKGLLENTPMIFFYIIIVAYLGDGVLTLILVVCAFGWLDMACLIRNNLIILRNKDYNIVSKLYHVPTYKIALNNYLPSLLPIIFTSFAISLPRSVSFEITLSYFNFDVGSISLGKLLYSSISLNSCFSHPYVFLIPLLFLLFINFSVFVIGKTISEGAKKEGDNLC